MRIPSGVTDQYIYFVAVDATDFTTRETGLATWTVYRSRNGGAAAAMTTPTINETDSTNMPGVYELLLDEDMTIDAGDDSQEMVFHITHAGMAPVTRTIELYRPKITAGNTLGVASDGDISGNVDGNVVGSVGSVSGVTFPTNFGDLSITATTGRVDVAAIAGTAQTANDIGQDVNDILADTADMQPKLGTFSDLGSGATLSGNLEDMRDDGTATYSRTTDSLQAIRDRGDAAWTSGAGSGLTPLASGTAQGGTASTIQLAAGETFANNILDGNIVKITSGTGAGQSRLITSYTGATDTASVTPNWITNPDATSVYEVVEGSANLAAISNDAQSVADLKDFADAGYDPATNKVQGVVLVDTTTTNTDMRGTDSALLAANAPTNFADLAITATTGQVTVGTNNDKTGYSLTQTFPTNFADLAITATTGRVTVGTNADKTGYSLTQTFPTNFADLSISATTGLVDITQAAADKAWSTATRALTDKAGFSLSGTKTTLDALNDITAAAVWSVTLTELSADPGASPAASGAVLLPYMAIRNKRDTTATSDEIHNDAGTVLLTATISDDGSVFSKTKYA